MGITEIYKKKKKGKECLTDLLIYDTTANQEIMETE